LKLLDFVGQLACERSDRVPSERSQASWPTDESAVAGLNSTAAAQLAGLHFAGGASVKLLDRALDVGAQFGIGGEWLGRRDLLGAEAVAPLSAAGRRGPGVTVPNDFVAITGGRDGFCVKLASRNASSSGVSLFSPTRANSLAVNDPLSDEPTGCEDSAAAS